MADSENLAICLKTRSCATEVLTFRHEVFERELEQTVGLCSFAYDLQSASTRLHALFENKAMLKRKLVAYTSDVGLAKSA